MKGICFFIALIICVNISTTAAKKPKEPPCCSGDNVFTRLEYCIDGDSTKLVNCTDGRFMMDPINNDYDKYEITDEGLEIVSNGYITPRTEFCTTNYREIGSNETRKVALVCFKHPVYDMDTVMAVFLAKGCLSLISVIFIVATLYVYWLIPDLRETQDKVTCIALTCLMIFLLFLGTIQIVWPDKLGRLCELFALIVYFFTMAYFTWLNIIMVNVWKTTVLPKWRISEKIWYLSNHVYGWTVPVILTANLICQHTMHPIFSERSCWFQEKRDTWLYLYTPISVMLGLNVILFIWSAWEIHASGTDVSPDRKKALMYKFRLYLQLFLMAGIMWIFEVLSFHFGGYVHEGTSYWIIADILNGLHGVLIFLVLIVWRRRIRKELSGKRILCFRAPSSWSQVEYPEEEQLNEDDEHTKYDLIAKK